MDLKQKYFNEIDNIKGLTMSVRRGEIHELHPEVRKYKSMGELANAIDERLDKLISKIEKNEKGLFEKIEDLDR